MTTFAPHRATLEAFVDCIHGGVDEGVLTGLLAEDVVLYGPFGDEPVTGRDAAVETIKSVNKLSSDATYLEVLSGETHHAAHFRLQVRDAAVNGRDRAKAADLAKALGNSVTTGEFGAVPAGDIVIVALGYANVVPVVTKYGDALAGKVIVEISNPFNSDADGLAIADDTSIAQQVAKAAPANASVVKAFNTVFGHVLKQGRTLDVFFAGDDAQAKAGVSKFIESLGLRPLDVGGLHMAHWLEGTGLVLMGIARQGLDNFDVALGATEFSG